MKRCYVQSNPFHLNKLCFFGYLARKIFPLKIFSDEAIFENLFFTNFHFTLVKNSSACCGLNFDATDLPNS